MKRLTLISILLVVVALSLTAQQRRGQQAGRNPERFDRFRKMKLIEVLKLNEEDAARFVAKESAHEETQKKLLEDRNNLLDDMRKSVKDNADPKSLQKPTDQVIALDEQMFKERRR